MQEKLFNEIQEKLIDEKCGILDAIQVITAILVWLFVTEADNIGWVDTKKIAKVILESVKERIDDFSKCDINDSELN